MKGLRWKKRALKGTLNPLSYTHAPIKRGKNLLSDTHALTESESVKISPQLAQALHAHTHTLDKKKRNQKIMAATDETCRSSVLVMLLFLGTHKQHPQQRQQKQKHRRTERKTIHTCLSIQTTTNRITPQTTTAIPPHTRTHQQANTQTPQTHTQTPMGSTHTHRLRHAQTQTMSANKFAKKQKTKERQNRSRKKKTKSKQKET